MSIVISEVTPVSPLTPLSPVFVTETPIIVTTTTESIILSDPSPSAPYVTSLNFGYTTPVIGVYDNLNADVNVHNRMTKYYYHKILEKWLYEDLLDVLSYFKMKGNEVDVLDDLNEYKAGSAERDSEANREKKIDFLEKYFLTKSFVMRAITEFVHSTYANWYDLYKHEYLLIELFKKKLIKRVKKAIVEKERIRK